MGESAGGAAPSRGFVSSSWKCSIAVGLEDVPGARAVRVGRTFSSTSAGLRAGASLSSSSASIASSSLSSRSQCPSSSFPFTASDPSSSHVGKSSASRSFRSEKCESAYRSGAGEGLRANAAAE